MTNEQAAEQYMEILEAKSTYPDWDYDDVKYAFLAGIEYAEGNRWVRVEDAMPEKGDNVLVFGKWAGEINSGDGNYSVGLAQWVSADYSECIGTDTYAAWYTNITHWMNAPEPPINAITAPTGQDNEKDDK